MTQDRIPTRVDTPVTVTIAGFSPPMAPVRLSIAGASAVNGTATIDGGATADLTGTATVQLRGTAQTAIGNAGNLLLVAEQGGKVIGEGISLVRKHRRGQSGRIYSLAVNNAQRGHLDAAAESRADH